VGEQLLADNQRQKWIIAAAERATDELAAAQHCGQDRRKKNVSWPTKTWSNPGKRQAHRQDNQRNHHETPP